MLYSVTQRSISFLYSIYIFSINMPQDESLKKVQSNSISIVAMYDGGGGEGKCCAERLTFATKMHSLWWCRYDVASNVCVNCQRSGSILPPLLELWHCSSYECFSVTCSLHSLRGKGIHVELGTFFSSLRTIDTLYRETVKCISEVDLWKEVD